MRNSNLEVRIAGSSCRLQLDYEQSIRVELDLECGKECHEYDKCLCCRLPVPKHLFYFIFFLELLLGNRENFLYRACNQRLIGKFSSVSRVIGHYPNPRNDHCCDQFVFIYIFL